MLFLNLVDSRSIQLKITLATILKHKFKAENSSSLEHPEDFVAIDLEINFDEVNSKIYKLIIGNDFKLEL